MIGFVYLLFFLAVTLLIYSAYITLFRRYTSGERLVNRRLSDFQKDRLKNADVPFITRDDQLSQIPLLNKVLARLDIAARLKRMLEQADMTMTVGMLTLIMLVAAASGYILTLYLDNILISIAMAFLSSTIPVFYVNMRRNRRLKKFIQGFPDALDMMISALKAGHAFNKALQLVANEAPDPIGIEFRRTFEENSLGIPLKEALLNLTRRVDSVDLKLFVTSVLLQKETGGNLTEILQKIALTIRDRFKLMGQLKTFTAQGRLSMWILGMLPIGFLLLMLLLNPNYLMPLFTDKTGNILLFAAFFLQLIGFFIIRKIVTIKFQ